jgi:hypothetical protein
VDVDNASGGIGETVEGSRMESRVNDKVFAVFRECRPLLEGGNGDFGGCMVGTDG